MDLIHVWVHAKDTMSGGEMVWELELRVWEWWESNGILEAMHGSLNYIPRHAELGFRGCCEL